MGPTPSSEQSFSQLSPLADAERRRVILERNATQAEYPKDQCIHELFEQQARRTPEAIAVVFEQEQLTYSALNARANQLAHHLRRLGVGPEVLVGICAERGLELVVGVLGILKAGGAYVPLDPAYPPERLAFMLEDSRACVLLTQHRLREHLPEHRAHALCLDTEWDKIAQEGEKNPAPRAMPDNLAYVIYTSGSTGKPKGVQIQHGSVVNFLTSMAKEPGLTAADRLLAVTTLSFDIGGLEFYLPLTVGASLELVSRAVASDSLRLRKWLATSGWSERQSTQATRRMRS